MRAFAERLRNRIRMQRNRSMRRSSPNFFSHVLGPRSPLHGTKIGDKLSPRIRKHGRSPRSFGCLVAGRFCWLVGWMMVRTQGLRLLWKHRHHRHLIGTASANLALVALQVANGGGAGFGLGEPLTGTQLHTLPG